jgi:hypothetical protein
VPPTGQAGMIIKEETDELSGKALARLLVENKLV